MREQSDNKGFPKFLGTNLTYLLRLTQVIEHESLPSTWKAPAYAPKRQHTINLQRESYKTSGQLGVRAPVVTTPRLLNMTLSPSFRLDQMDDLGTGLH